MRASAQASVLLWAPLSLSWVGWDGVQWELGLAVTSLPPLQCRGEAIHLRDLWQELHQPPQHEAAPAHTHGREALSVRRVWPALPLLQHAEGTQGEMFPSQPPTAQRSRHPAHRTPAVHSPTLPHCSSQAGHQLTPSTGPPGQGQQKHRLGAVLRLDTPGAGSWCMLGAPSAALCKFYSFGSKGTERDWLATPLQVRGARSSRCRLGARQGLGQPHLLTPASLCPQLTP